MITIENKKTYQGDGIYIGRPSLLGNPFRIGEDGTRNEVIDRYRVWLWKQIKLRGEVYRWLQRLAAIAKEEDLILICWCKRPDRQIACHGDVVKRAVEYLLLPAENHATSDAARFTHRFRTESGD